MLVEKKYKKIWVIAGIILIITFGVGGLLEWRYKQTSFFAGAEYNNPRIEFIMNRALRRAAKDNVASEETIRDYLRSYNNVVLIQGATSWVKNGSNRTGTLTISISSPENFNIVLHEARHIALFAIGTPRERHHEIMLQRNWCFAGNCEHVAY